MHRGIEDVARAHGVLAFAGSSDEDSERERELVQAFLSRRVDGLIIVPAGADHGYLLRDRDAGVALVFVDRPPGFIDADVVMSDHAGGARAATGHLLAAGHRRIGYLGDRRRIHSAVERLRGHTRGARRGGRPYDPALVRMELEDSATARRATRSCSPARIPRPPCSPPEPHHDRRRRARCATRAQHASRSSASTT